MIRTRVQTPPVTSRTLLLLVGLGCTLGVLLLVAIQSAPRPTVFLALVGAVCPLAGWAIVSSHTELFSLRELTPGGLFLASNLAMVAIPSYWVFLDSNDPSRFTYFAAMQSVLVTVPAGVVAAAFILPRRPMAKLTAAQEEASWSRLRTLWNIGMVIGIVIVAWHTYEVQTIPVMALIELRGEELDIARLREAAGTTLPGIFNHYFFVWNRILLLPALVVVALAGYRHKHHKSWAVRLCISFVVALYHGTLTAEKSFAAMVFVSIGAYLFLAQGQKKASVLTILKWLTLGLVFPAFMYWWSATYQDRISDVLKAIGLRLFYAPASVASLYFELVPDQIHFLYGASSRLVASLTGQQFFDLPNYIYVTLWSPGWVRTGSANAVFSAAAWADFGWAGVLVSGFLVGALAHLIYRISTGPRDVISLAVRSVMVTVFTIVLNSVALWTVFLTYGLVPLLLVVPIARRFILKKSSTG